MQGYPIHESWFWITYQKLSKINQGLEHVIKDKGIRFLKRYIHKEGRAMTLHYPAMG